MKKFGKLGKTVLLSSLAALAFGGVALGTTFALFTSKTETSITATTGKVKVTTDVEITSIFSPTNITSDGSETSDENGAELTDKKKGTFLNNGTVTVDNDGNVILDRMTPGDKVTISIALTNDSTVAFKLRTKLLKANDSGLYSGLKIEKPADFGTWKAKNPDEDLGNYEVTISLPSDAGNEYQNTSCELKLIVDAVQGNADTSAYTIGSAAELSAFAEEISKNTSFGYKKVTLTSDIDMKNQTYLSPCLSTSLVFEGNGHTIYNFAPSAYTNGGVGLFGRVDADVNLAVNDLKFENANIVGKGIDGSENAGGAVIGWNENYNSEKVISLSNIEVKNSTITDNKFSGAILGYSSNLGGVTIKASSISKVAVKARTAGGFVGHFGGGKGSIDSPKGTDVSVAGTYREGGLIGAVSAEDVTVTNYSEENYKSEISWTADADKGPIVGLASGTTVNGKAIAVADLSELLKNDDAGYFTCGNTNENKIEIDGGELGYTVTNFQDLWVRSELTIKNISFANGITIHADSKKPTIQFINCTFAGTIKANVKADGNKIGGDNIGDGMCIDFESNKIGGDITLTDCESIGRNDSTVCRDSTIKLDRFGNPVSPTQYKARGYGFAVNAIAGDPGTGATNVTLQGFHVKGVSANAVQLSGQEVHTIVKDSFIESWGINSRKALNPEGEDDKVSAAFRGLRANVIDWTLTLENVEFGMDENIDKTTARPTPLVRYIEISGTGSYGGNTDGTLKKGIYSMANNEAPTKK